MYILLSCTSSISYVCLYYAIMKMAIIQKKGMGAVKTTYYTI